MINYKEKRATTGWNQYEIDSVAHLSMDVAFAVINFVVGYKLLADKRKAINRSIRRVLIAFYIMFML